MKKIFAVAFALIALVGANALYVNAKTTNAEVVVKTEQTVTAKTAMLLQTIPFLPLRMDTTYFLWRFFITSESPTPVFIPISHIRLNRVLKCIYPKIGALRNCCLIAGSSQNVLLERKIIASVNC